MHLYMSSSTYNELAVNVYIELVTTSCTVKFRMVIGDWLVAGGRWPVARSKGADFGLFTQGLHVAKIISRPVLIINSSRLNN